MKYESVREHAWDCSRQRAAKRGLRAVRTGGKVLESHWRPVCFPLRDRWGGTGRSREGGNLIRIQSVRAKKILFSIKGGKNLLGLVIEALNQELTVLPL